MVYCIVCSPMARETGVQSQVESYQRLKKCYLISPCLTQHYKVRIKGKVEQSKERSSALFETPWPIWYRKGNLWVAVDDGRQLYY